ncbi:MAG: DnaJ family domain-containing protein [Acidobacteriota bacterium]
MFGKLIEEKIREAMDAGDFDNLPGTGINDCRGKGGKTEHDSTLLIPE